jgi:hypothetical protein
MSNVRTAPGVHCVMMHALFILAPLASGLMIYLVHRAPVTWLHAHVFQLSSGSGTEASNWLESFYLFHLPDVLWAFSLAYALCYNGYRYKKQISPALILGSIAIFECSQLLSSTLTFDWLDLVFELAAGVAAMMVFKKIT